MSLFNTDPSDLPSNPGVPVSALPMPSEDLEVGSRLASSFAKFSASRVLMGENEERWSQEAHEELLRQHPWLSAFTVSSDMTATTPDGYGVGFFRITPSVVPAAVAGPETVNVITIPIVIRDFRLYPLDLFGHEDQLFPLTEDRVIPLLRLRDAFTEVDRDFSRLNLKRTTARGVGSGSGSGFFSSTFKGSAAEVRQKVEELSMSYAAALDAVPTEADFDGATVFAELNEKVSEYARPCAAEIVIDKDVQYRMAWASGMENGKPQVEPFQKSSMAELREIFGDDVVSDALASRHVVLNLNDDDPATLYALLKRDVAKTSSAPMEPVRVASFLNKLSMPGPASVQRFIALPKDKYETLLPKEFTGVPVHQFEVGKSNRCNSRGLLGVIEQEGWFMEARSWDGDRNLYCMESLPIDATAAPVGCKGLGEGSSCDSSYALWQQGGAVYGVRVGPHSVDTADGTYWPVVERYGDNYGTLVRISPDFQTAFTEVKGDTTVLHLPMTAWIVAYDGIRSPGQPFTLQGAPAAGQEQGFIPEMQEPMPDSLGPEAGQEMPELPHDVKVSFDGSRYHAEIGKVFTSGKRPEVEFALAAAGVPGRLSNVLMDSCVIAGKESSAKFRSPYHGAGAEFLKKASSHITTRLGAAGSAPDSAVAGAKWVTRHFEGDLLKEAGADGAAVDTVLALGFLNEDNLLRYVDMAPTFEKAMSYLCSLLMASRLGLDEVPEPSVEAAIRGIDRILSSLRVVEYALTK